MWKSRFSIFKLSLYFSQEFTSICECIFQVTKLNSSADKESGSIEKPKADDHDDEIFCELRKENSEMKVKITSLETEKQSSEDLRARMNLLEEENKDLEEQLAKKVEELNECNAKLDGKMEGI